MIDIRQLQQFVMVASELNFGRAARRLHMSQPPLSTAIRRLEQSVGARLLDRTRHYVRLTPAGEIFLEEARRTIAQARFAIEAAQGVERGLTGVLRLSFVPSAALDFLPGVLQRFQAAYPSLRLVLTTATTRKEIEALHAQSVDAAIIVPPLADTTGLDISVLRTATMVLAVPGTHRLAGRKSVALTALSREAFISFPFAEGRGFAGAVLAACHAAGFTPRIVQEASQMLTILTLVASGLGVAVVPGAMKAMHLDNVSFVEISNARKLLHYDLALASPSNRRNAMIKAFVEIARRGR